MKVIEKKIIIAEKGFLAEFFISSKIKEDALILDK